MAMGTLSSVYKGLKEAGGAFVSGQKLADEAGISRAAIWKAVSSLQEAGFQVEAQKHHGYRLLPGEAYNAVTLQLLHEPLPTYFLEEVDSTNSEARRLVDRGVEAPFVVIARQQSGGRGRRGRSFSSPEGGVYLSLVVPVKAGFDPGLVTTAACTGVARAIDSLGFDSRIKWVNDIYISGKKAVGILCEGVVSMEDAHISDIVIGIGVNYEGSSFPPGLEDIATSLYPEGGPPVSRAAFTKRMVDEVMTALSSDDYLAEYKRKCFVLGQEVDVITFNGVRKAQALDIDDQAHLIVRYEDGSTQALSSAEVSLRLKPRPDLG